MKQLVIGVFIGLAVGLYFGQKSSPVIQPKNTSLKGNIKKEILSKPSRNLLKAKTREVTLSQDQHRFVEEDHITAELQKIDEATSSESYEIYKDLYRSYPKSKTVLEQYSSFLVRSKKWTEAISTLKKCVKNYPSSEVCQANLVNTLQQKGNKKDQLEAIENCLDVNHKNVACLNSYANYSLRYGDYKNALKFFKEMFIVNGQGLITFEERYIEYGMGLSYRGLGKLDRAKDYFKLSCQSNLQTACRELEQLDL
ncbi:hypothetical protein A9Q84_13700 [Halobacteriovorax marinus]|mgnify:CR=1 FL=1|uniref:Uncharacterized protein n=1 Tax=Halobacteriovorax marinus TaxID=97084 RepID=A0A1Y5F9A3_9BACT|nr:hypothetical protein A9Q84_13700 [Halobacteriovorax marinus]